MAALTNFRPFQTRMSRITTYPVLAASKIWGGGLVQLTAAGYARKAAAGVAGTVVGAAEETVDNLTGASGDKFIAVRGSEEHEEFCYANDGASPVAQDDVGKTCFVVDDQTVGMNAASGANIAAGTVAEVTSEGVWLRFAF